MYTEIQIEQARDFANYMLIFSHGQDLTNQFDLKHKVVNLGCWDWKCDDD